MQTSCLKNGVLDSLVIASSRSLCATPQDSRRQPPLSSAILWHPRPPENPRKMPLPPTLPVLVPPPSAGVPARPDDPPPPAIVARAGGGRFAWDEFFVGEIRNAHTRKNYRHAVLRFLTWC